MSEFAKFVSDLASSLHAVSVLYMGCKPDLQVPGVLRPCGVSRHADDLAACVEKYPRVEYIQTNPANTPYGDEEFDLVFTHKLFNYSDEYDTQRLLDEMYRLSSRYIANFEIGAGADGFGSANQNSDQERSPIQEQNPDQNSRLESGHTCDMYSRWINFRVKIISNVTMHPEIDPERAKFTLVRKI